MKQTIFLTIFSILLLMVISCEKNKSPSTIEDMNLPQQLTSSGHEWEAYWSPNMEYIPELVSHQMESILFIQ